MAHQVIQLTRTTFSLVNDSSRRITATAASVADVRIDSSLLPAGAGALYVTRAAYADINDAGGRLEFRVSDDPSDDGETDVDNPLSNAWESTGELAFRFGAHTWRVSGFTDDTDPYSRSVHGDDLHRVRSLFDEVGLGHHDGSLILWDGRGDNPFAGAWETQTVFGLAVDDADERRVRGIAAEALVTLYRNANNWADYRLASAPTFAGSGATRRAALPLTYVEGVGNVPESGDISLHFTLSGRYASREIDVYRLVAAPSSGGRAPAKPTASRYEFSTDGLFGLTATWTRNRPLSIPPGQILYCSTVSVTDNGEGRDDSIAFSAPAACNDVIDIDIIYRRSGSHPAKPRNTAQGVVAANWYSRPGLIPNSQVGLLWECVRRLVRSGNNIRWEHDDPFRAEGQDGGHLIGAADGTFKATVLLDDNADRYEWRWEFYGDIDQREEDWTNLRHTTAPATSIGTFRGNASIRVQYRVVAGSSVSGWAEVGVARIPKHRDAPNDVPNVSLVISSGGVPRVRFGAASGRRPIHRYVVFLMKEGGAIDQLLGTAGFANPDLSRDRSGRQLLGAGSYYALVRAISVPANDDAGTGTDDLVGDWVASGSVSFAGQNVEDIPSRTSVQTYSTVDTYKAGDSVVLTQAQYDAIANPVSGVVYKIRA